MPKREASEASYLRLAKVVKPTYRLHIGPGVNAALLTYPILPILTRTWDGVSLKTPRPRGWVGAGRPSGCKSSFNKRNMYQYPHVSQLFILLPWQSRVYPEPLKVVEFVQLTTECCWGQPSDPCQRGCLTSHACVMWGPRTLNADDDDDDDDLNVSNIFNTVCIVVIQE